MKTNQHNNLRRLDKLEKSLNLPNLLGLLAHLAPKTHANHITFICPDCQRKDKAYIYLEKPDGRPNSFGDWRCSRDSCSGQGSLLNPSKDTRPRPSKARKKPKTEVHDRSDKLAHALGKLSGKARTYLETRLPDIDLQKLLEAGLIGHSKLVKDTSARSFNRKGYEIFLPLYGIEKSQLVTGQCRYIDSQHPNHAPKILSLKGSYPSKGATFGSFKDALEAAQTNNQTLIVAEGWSDFLTLRGLGFENVLGVPGAIQAKKVAQRLLELDWQGSLYLSLDGDEAGAKSVHRVLEVLDNNPKIKVLNARPKHGLDVNDLLLKDGPQAVLKLLEQASPVRFDPLKAKTKKHKIPKAFRLSPEGREQARQLYYKDPDNKALRGIGRSGICGYHLTYQWRTLLDADKRLQEMLKGKGVAVCESRACLSCRSKLFNHITESVLSFWPETLSIVRIPLEDNTPAQAKKHRTRLTSRTSKVRKQCEQGYVTFVDPQDGFLTVVIDPEFKDLAKRLEKFYQVESLDRKSVLDRIIKPAFMALAHRVYKHLQDTNQGLDKIEQDPWCTSRSRAWSATKFPGRLSLLSESQVEKKQKEEAKLQKEEQEKLDPAPMKSFDLFVYCAAQSGEIQAITLQRLSPENRLALVAKQPLTLLPGQRGNLLWELDDIEAESPKLAKYLRSFYKRRAGRELATASV